jgi:hypothetical protein
MVAKRTAPGLIATTRADATPPLEELVACCGWPLLLEAGPRRLLRELALRRPECLLFWTDDWYDVGPTAELITWSRRRGNRPFRVAVAYELTSEAEAVFRAAGAHSFLAVTGRPGTAIAEALGQLVASAAPAVAVGELVGPAEFASELVRPP